MEPYIEDYDETEDEEDDEGDTDELISEPTGVYCVQCTDEIELTSEVFLLRIVRPFIVNGELKCPDVLAENQSFRYEPAFYCFGCWEEAIEEVQTKYEDTPPVHHPEGIILCDLCESDILQGEAMGLLEFGELHWSERAPNNRYSPVFVSMNDIKHVCAACITRIEIERGDPLWPGSIEPVQDFGKVCTEGTFKRCWRHGNCNCK